MNKSLWLDLDGTLYDLYGIPNWLERLENEDVRIFLDGRPLVEMDRLRAELLRLVNEGWKVGIITLTPWGTSEGYCEKVAVAKQVWLYNNLRDVELDVRILPYNVTKTGNGILIDDNAENRANWNGDRAYDVDNLLETLATL